MRGKIAGLVLCLAAAAHAEDSAMLNEDDVWKLYTTPQVKFMDIDGDSATIGALGIGTILNDHWYFGIVGHFLADDVEGDDFRIDNWNLWDAGGEIGYIFAPASLVHLDASVYLGGGEVEDDFSFDGESASFMVVEPQFAACLNLHEIWELCVGVGYRHTDGVDGDGLDDDDLSDITLRVFLRATEF